jgi:hypothetical protein
MPDRYMITGDDGAYRPERYATKEDAEHARRVIYGNRALAHPIVRVADLMPSRKKQ